MTIEAQKTVAFNLLQDCARVSNDMCKLRKRCSAIASNLAEDKEANQKVLDSLAAIEEQLRKAQTGVVANSLKIVLTYLQNP